MRFLASCCFYSLLLSVWAQPAGLGREEQRECSAADRDHGALFAGRCRGRRCAGSGRADQHAVARSTGALPPGHRGRRASNCRSGWQLEKDPLVRQDLEILIAQADRDIRSSEATERILLPYDERRRHDLFRHQEPAGRSDRRGSASRRGGSAAQVHGPGAGL